MLTSDVALLRRLLIPEMLMRYARGEDMSNPVLGIARKSGIARSMVTAYLEGRLSPSYPTCRILAQTLRLNRKVLMEAASCDRRLRSAAANAGSAANGDDLRQSNQA